jgi:putative NADH-flavin reductase
MQKVLILGANGQIAKLVEERLLAETDYQLTLYLRHADRIKVTDPSRERIVEGDVNDLEKLNAVMQGQDIVYANLGGTFEPMAKNIIRSMDQNDVKRLIWITGLGLYHELPKKFDQWLEESIGHEVMEDTRRAAQIIETSDIDYTLLRCAYMNNDDEIDYSLTEKGEEYQGTIISRKSIADLVVKIIKDPKLHQFASLGIAKPHTNGDKPLGY